MVDGRVMENLRGYDKRERGDLPGHSLFCTTP